ncbi:MAG: pentapeptide repeat-containing protein [Nostoc sp. EkiNYC01]|nr:pentapeptide repeat-containing protein [Nostoc sp. EkiNYC01]
MGRSCRASTEGLEKAKGKFKLKGWTQDHLAGRADCTRQTVGKFFARQLVDQSKFQAICHELGLELGDVAELESEPEQLSRSDMDTAQQNPSESHQKASSTAKQSTIRKAIFILSGTIDTVDKAKLKAIEEHLRKISGDANLTFTDVEEGSIKITLEGSSEGLARLQELFESGELTEVLGIPVEDIQIRDGEDSDNNESKQFKNFSGIDLRGIDLSGVDLRDYNFSDADLRGANLSATDLRGADLKGADLRGTNINEKTEIDGKWLLVWETVNHRVEGRDLSNADLSGANLIDADLSGAILISANLTDVNLSGANLSGANLIDADLSGANLSDADLRASLSSANFSDANLSGADLRTNLSGANLSGANLSDANLSGANLSGANLSGANLSGANLSGANLESAIVMNAFFVDTRELTENMKRDLERRGAIFGDRPPVLNSK